MTEWSELREALLHAQADPQPLLQSFPDPRSTITRRPPFHIGLTVAGLSLAAELHERFGPTVELTVGYLPYPPHRIPEVGFDDVPQVAAEIATFTTPEPLIVPSGGHLRVDLTATNHTSDILQISDGPTLRGRVIDPSTGSVVGFDSRPTRAMLMAWNIPAGATIAIPLQLGTDSCRMDLGYAVPPGQWATYAPFTIDDGTGAREARTPLLPLTIS